MDPSKKDRSFIQSMAKGLSAIQVFVAAGNPLTLSELARALDTTNATALRICHTLKTLGFIQRNGQKQYLLTPKILTLGYPAVCAMGWREVAGYYLECLFEEVQETVNLAVSEGADIMYLIRIRKRKYLPIDIRIGTRLPFYATALGKVLMAMGPPDKTAPVLESITFRPLTAHTINRPGDLHRELENVRARGYATNDEELSIGNRAVAAPVFDEKGFAAAAINIAMPTTQYTVEEMKEKMVAPVLRTAGQISEALNRIETRIMPEGSL